ncbi:hypothetical protein [Streptomyces sp. NPDC006739]|uniref:hypothetical protein n=1 Tax=Streptomyces sp. NPDC006739 TaxID=3364763 RepID=UPI0036B656CC
MPRRAPALVATALLAATVAGCAAAGGASAPVPAPAGASGRPAPGGDDRTLQLAEQLLIKGCMEKRGFAYWTEEPRTAADGARRFPYVVDDPAWARAHGYGTDLYRARQREVLRDPNQRYLRSLPASRGPALVSALNGARPQGLSARLPNGVRVTHSDQGCAAEAQRELYKDLPAWFRATRVRDSLDGMRVGLVLGDAKYRAATEPWARCLRGRGYPYRSPAEARAAATEPGREWPHAREVRLASAEAACAESTGLASVAKSLDAKYRTELRRRYPEEAADLARLRREALPRARAIVARGD